jgi:cellulose synthase (UDP-forming)
VIKTSILEQSLSIDVLRRTETQMNSGLLVAKSGEQEIELYFQQGRLQSIGHKEHIHLGARLTRDGTIAKDHLREAWLAQATSANQSEFTFALALMQHRRISREQLDIWLTQEALKLLQNLLTGSEYEVYFHEGIPTPADRFPLNYRVTSLIEMLLNDNYASYNNFTGFAHKTGRAPNSNPVMPWSSPSVTPLPSTPATSLFKKPQSVITERPYLVKLPSARSTKMQVDKQQVSASTRPPSPKRTALENLGTIPMQVIKIVPQIVWSETQKIRSFGQHKNTLYADTSTIVGPLQEGNKIHYRNVFSRTDNWVLWIFTLLNVVTSWAFIGWILWPTNFNYSDFVSNIAQILILFLMAMVEFIRFAQSAALLFFSHQAKDPIPLKPKPGQRVAVLTTIVPGKEPLDLVYKTLWAMKRIKYDGLVDVWLLDEGNSPEVKVVCASLNVKHFSRKGIPEFNQPSGQFRAKTKHGNHNAWRAQNEQYYDIVAQMDPDHVPTEDFLLRVIGYFNDPDVGFVVAPQVYGNLAENWIAKGSAILVYVFHGIIQRGGNRCHAPLLIGTNHAYKTACFKQINGYQDCIIEDHLTSMVVFATRNPKTDNYWKGVYTPDILAVGEGPTSFTDFFSQQMRWAYGIWEIVLQFSPKLFPRMRKTQQFTFTLLQMFYPSVAISWILSNLVTITCTLLGVYVHQLLALWAVLWGSSVISSLGLFFWLRKFNLVEHERKDSGLVGMGLMLMCIPIYTEAALRKLSGKPLAYVVTAKGKLTSGDSLQTFSPHIKWALLLATTLVLNFLGVGIAYPASRIWLCINITICISPILVHYVSLLKGKNIRVPKNATTQHSSRFSLNKRIS